MNPGNVLVADAFDAVPTEAAPQERLVYYARIRNGLPTIAWYSEIASNLLNQLHNRNGTQPKP